MNIELPSERTTLKLGVVAERFLFVVLACALIVSVGLSLIGCREASTSEESALAKQIVSDVETLAISSIQYVEDIVLPQS